MDSKKLAQHIAATWHDSVIPRLVDYITIPAKSPLFDPDWAAHGDIDRAVTLAGDWAFTQPIADMKLEVERLPGLTPTIMIDIPAFFGTPAQQPLLERDIKIPTPKNVLIYGHLDKQPEMTGWREGLGPWQPVIEDGKLYGRGGADDGYAIFSALSAIAALPALETLRMGGSGISNAQLAILAKIKSLGALTLNGTQLTADAVEPLKNLRGLRDLDIRDTEIPPAAVAELRKLLPKCKVDR